MYEPKEILEAVKNGDLNKIKKFIKSGGSVYKEYLQEEFYKVPETLISRALNLKQTEIVQLLLQEYENDYKIALQKVLNEENKDFLMKYIFIAFDEVDIQEVLKLSQTESNKNCNLVLLADRKVCVLVPIVHNKSLLYKLSRNGFVNINSRGVVGTLPDNGIAQIGQLDLLKRSIEIGLDLKVSYQDSELTTENLFLEGIFRSVECVEMIKYCLNQVQELSSQDILLLTAFNKNHQVFEVVLSYITRNTSKSNEDYLKEFITNNINFSSYCCWPGNFDLLTHILVKYKINVIDIKQDKTVFYKEYLKTEKSLKYFEEIIKFKFENLVDVLEAVTLDTNPEIIKFIWRNLKEEHFKKFNESIVLIIKLAHENTIESNILKYIEKLDPKKIYDKYMGNTALFVAIQFECEPIVSNLIARGANLLHKNALNETALTTACEFSSPEIIKIILKEEPSLVNVAGQDRFFPITKLVAREKINFEILNDLIRVGAKTDVKCCRNNTLLHHAVLAGRTDFVQSLLALGIDPSLQNIDGHTALYCSTKRENIEIFNLILDTGKTDIETKTYRNHTVLYRACKSYTPDFFNSLMEKTKPNVHVIDNKGQTPLFWCHDVARCEKLLELGTDHKILDENNLPFYTFAALKSNEKMVEFCLQKSDLDLTIVGNNGKTLLHAICGMDIRFESFIANENVKEMFRKCTNIISDHETPFHIATIYYENFPFLKYMFEYAEPNLENKNEKGETPIFGNLRYSCNLEVLNYLIEKGANVNAQNNEGNTIIFDSIYPIGTEILLSSGASVNILNNKGQTALHFAAMRDDLDTILLLLKYGADLNLEDLYDMRPVDYCKRSYIKGFLEFLGKSSII